MALYSTYNPIPAGGVLTNNKPRVYPFPRTPTYTTGGNGHRLQPTERGNFFLRNGSNVAAQPLGAVNPGTDSTMGGCAGGCGNCNGCGNK